MIFHAVPYAGSTRCGRCPMQVCGGLIPDPDCPDHGVKREPAMSWHEADGERCRELGRGPRYQCSAGHLLPDTFRPPATEPDDWDDSCETNCRRT
ncbi:hypothetical protein [Streptomyces sp. CPS1]